MKNIPRRSSGKRPLWDQLGSYDRIKGAMLLASS